MHYYEVYIRSDEQRFVIWQEVAIVRCDMKWVPSNAVATAMQQKYEGPLGMRRGPLQPRGTQAGGSACFGRVGLGGYLDGICNPAVPMELFICTCMWPSRCAGGTAAG